ncbi:LuxR C-terminal-related transcriptional regulator [Streptomyces sp. NPDC058914]|uniref:LuxR C-terminal-related transcriptional regulator n=1 Tax=Streptomyces TaxID=1883 RepID=UPI0036C724E8
MGLRLVLSSRTTVRLPWAYVVRPLTNEEPAAELPVSLSTVKTHLGSGQRKIAARNRMEIAIWAHGNGMCAGRDT